MPNKDEYYNSLNCIQNKNGILKSLENGKISFADYGLLTSELHSSYLKSIQGLDLSIFEKEARDSWQKFDTLNTINEKGIDEFIDSYNSKL